MLLILFLRIKQKVNRVVFQWMFKYNACATYCWIRLTFAFNIKMVIGGMVHMVFFL